jgi:hypothetical protein
VGANDEKGRLEVFDEDMIAGRHLTLGPRRATPSVRMQLRLPWYRSLPLSCVEGLEVELDGRRTPDEHLALRVNGHHHPVYELRQLHEVWWFVLDALELVVATSAEVDPGAHRVAVTLRLRIPYGDRDFRNLEFVQVARCAREMQLLERGA